jgi:membrane-bound lytic murein transglycosylase F
MKEMQITQKKNLGKWMILWIFFLFIFSSISSCIYVWEKWTEESFEDVKKRGKLRVILPYNQTSYFLYKEEKMGFEYELLVLLSKELGLELEINTTKDIDNLPFLLNSYQADIVAAHITVTKKRQKELSFTENLLSTRQVLVQRKKNPQDVSKYLLSVVDMVGKKIYVRKKSVFYTRLKTLEGEIGGKFDIQTVEGEEDTEDLIEKVSKGEIDYTIAEETTALINQTYYENLDVSVPISFPLKISWVVRKNSPELLREVNKWIYKIKGDGTLQKIKSKYYKESKIMSEVAIEPQKEIVKQKTVYKISPYDAILQREAVKLGWDWRLLAAIIYQESKFKSTARSWAGASGLMQLMPSTAASLGLKSNEIFDPEKNIQAGVKYLIYLQNVWTKIGNQEQKIKFVLASYNAGIGHVIDARILAISLEKNPNIWDGNVEKTILLLSNPDYYNKDEIKYGYCRGKEPYEYIRIIFEKYKYYKGL